MGQGLATAQLVIAGTLSEKYTNLICEDDSFEARNRRVDERNLKFWKD